MSVARFQSHTLFTASDTKSEETPTRKRSWLGESTTISGKWREMYIALKSYHAHHNHTRVPYNYGPNPELGRWVSRQRYMYKTYNSTDTSNMKKKKKTIRHASSLTNERIQALQQLDFSFESKHLYSWNQRFDELCLYRAEYGDCLVPLHYEASPGLGVWVRNQRSNYRNILLGRSKQSLTPERIEALQSIGFTWDTQRNDQWKRRFDELRDFKSVYGHCHVPTNYFENPSLGTFVSNQRTAYKQYLAGERGSKSLTTDKIRALEAIGFCWEERHYNWYEMFTRLKNYRDEKHQQWLRQNEKEGTKDMKGKSKVGKEESLTSLPEFFYVPPEDLSNRDLRLWIAVQRREYKNGLTPNKRTSMTTRRKEMLESIGFCWQSQMRNGATGDASMDGPSVDDWKNLFDQMRERGIDSTMKPKEHWFEGQSLAQENLGDREWKDEDLLALWNSMNDDEDE